MADIKQRQAAANQAFFEQKAREYTRETGEKWSAKDVANHFEMVVRDMTMRGNTAQAVTDTWNEIAEYNGLNAPDAELYYGSDKTLGWNDYKSSTAITRDALQWGINTGAIKGSPSEQRTLFDAIQKSFNNLDSLSSLPPGFEEAMSTSNAMLGRTAAPAGGTLDNLLSNRNTTTPPISNIAPSYNAKQQQRMPAGRQPPAYERQLQSLQAQKTGTNMQRALDALPRIDPADRIAQSQLASSRASLDRSLREGAREKRNSAVNDAIFQARFSGSPIPAIPRSSAIEQLRGLYQAGQAQRFNPGTPNVAASRFAMEAPVNRTTSRTGSLGTTGFSQGSIPQMMPSGAMNVARPDNGTVRAGFNSTVPQSVNVASGTLSPQSIAYQRGLTAPEYLRATPLSQPTIDAARFNNVPTAQPNMTAADVRNSYNRGGAQAASVQARTPISAVGANSYFADPRVSGYMPGQSTGLRSVGGKTVGNQFSGMPAVSYASVPASVTWGGMANAAPTNSGFVNAAQVSNRNAEIGRALQEKAATYGTGGPAIDVMPASMTRSVSPRNVDVNQNIQPAPSYNVSVAPNGVSTATLVDQRSLQVGANRGVSRVAELAAKVGPAVAGGIVAGPVGAAIGSMVQNAAQTLFGGQQNRQTAQGAAASGGGSPAASFSGGGVAANPSGLSSGPVSYSVDPRSGNRDVTNSYGVTSTITPEGFTYGGPGGSSGKG
jgi:hypothetical protein